jgi:DNA-binding XRE family transcriptional regulator
MPTLINNFKAYTHDEMKDMHIGKVGTPERDAYEAELKIELLSHAIKTARKEQKLTQKELGALVGVQKAQISKLENNPKNVTIETITKVLNALNAKVHIWVELNDKRLDLA